MNKDELKIKVQELAEELGTTPEKVTVVISGLTGKAVTNAFSGEDDESLAKIEKFFTAREYAFSIYTDEQCDIVRQFEKRILAVGSAGKALENSGISAGTMSGIRTGTYKGDAEKMFSKISSFLELKNENSKVYKHSGYVPTSISESIYENIRTAHISGVCVIVTGDAGIGKTEAAMQYKATHPDNSVIITAEEPKTPKTVMLEKLAEELGTDLSGTRSSMYFRKILSELHDGTVIIVDEAQNFRFDAIDTLRGFADYFHNKNLGTVGIVCMGNDTFRQQFFGKSGIGKEQVWNRFVERPMYTTKNIRYEDIEVLFPELVKKNMQEELDFLCTIAILPQENIRSAVHLYTTVYGKHKGNCNIGTLTKQAKYMQIRIPDSKPEIDALTKKVQYMKQVAKCRR